MCTLPMEPLGAAATPLGGGSSSVPAAIAQRLGHGIALSEYAQRPATAASAAAVLRIIAPPDACHEFDDGRADANDDGVTTAARAIAIAILHGACASTSTAIVHGWCYCR